ncbi:hypothetical protein [Mycolicibacterium litorale]|nr:hypothetical protein [Mycolicibacterium litorale]
MFTAILVGGWWRLEATPLRRASWVLWLPTIAAGFDTLEYALLSALLYKNDERLFALRGDGGPLNWLSMAVSTAKWVAVAAMIVTGALAAAAWFTRRRDPFPPTTELSSPRRGAPTGDSASAQDRALVEPAKSVGVSDSRVGICLGGGGIRSAAFCVGALSQFEREGLLQSGSRAAAARHIAAVSGGAWAATAWTLQKALRPDESAADAVVARLTTDTGPTGYARHNYLANGRGGLVGAVGWAVLNSLTNLLLFALLIYLAAWPLGLVMTHCAIDSGQLGTAYCGPQPVPADQFHGPSIVFAVVGVVWLLMTGVVNNRFARTWPIGVLLLGLSIFVAACFIWIPAWFRSLDDLGLAAGFAALAIGLAVGVSIASGIWRLFARPAKQGPAEQAARWRRRLVAAVMLLGGIAWAVVVLYAVAMSVSISQQTPWGVVALPATSQVALVVPGALLLALYILLNPNFPSLHNIASAHLRRSFDPVGDHAKGSAAADAGTWQWLSTKTDVPELILCCTRQRSGLSGGLAAEAFTISPHVVHQSGARSYRTADYIDVANQIRRSPLARHEFRHISCVSSWLATTGLGTPPQPSRRARTARSTAVFAAAANAHVGIWLPNVKVLDSQLRSMIDGDTTKLFPRPRFGYLFKQIFGWYGADDRYVFVTDGGRRDSLGLAELLRRQCDVIFCVDATEESTPSFAALRQSLELAELEFGVDVNEVELEDALSGMLPGDGSPATASAATFTLHPSAEALGAESSPARPVTVHYTKLQSTRVAGPELKRWAIDDPGFPDFPSVGRALSNPQFMALVDLGKIAGAAVVKCAQNVRRPARTDRVHP